MKNYIKQLITLTGLILSISCNGTPTSELLTGNFADVDTEPPTLVIDEPAAGAENLYGEKIYIRGKAFDNREIDHVELSFNGEPFTKIDGGNIWQYEFSTFEIPSGNKNVIIRAFDKRGNFKDATISFSTSHPLHVSTIGTNTNEGLKTSPLQTISEAAERANLEGVKVIKIAIGTYAEVVTVKENMRLLGGYDETFSETTRVSKATAASLSSEIICPNNTVCPENPVLKIDQDNNTETTTFEGLKITSFKPNDVNKSIAISLKGKNIKITNNHINSGSGGSTGTCSNYTICRSFGIFTASYANNIIIDKNYISADGGVYNVGIAISSAYKFGISNNITIAKTAIRFVASISVTSNTTDTYLVNNTLIAEEVTSGLDDRRSSVIYTNNGARIHVINNILFGGSFVFPFDEPYPACYLIATSDSYWLRSPVAFENNLLANCVNLFYDQSPDNCDKKYDPTDTTADTNQNCTDGEIDDMISGTGTDRWQLAINTVSGNACADGTIPCEMNYTAETVLFTSSTDYNLSATSPALNTGLSIDSGTYSDLFDFEEVTKYDYNGNERTGIHDIGACEKQ